MEEQDAKVTVLFGPNGSGKTQYVPEKTLVMITHYEEEFPKCINNILYLKRQ